MTERYVTVAEIKDLLEQEAEKRKGTAGLLEDEDVLLSSQKGALQHAQKVTRISLDNTLAIVEEAKEVEGITDAVAVKIADLLPETPEDVRAILQKERINLTAEQTQQIIEIVEKYSL